MDAVPGTLPIEEIARAISSHRFPIAYPHLADDVSWTLVGEARLEGSQAVIDACEGTAQGLAGVSTEFQQFHALVGDDWVVIESVAAYTDAGGSTSVVASCDIYRFANGRLSAITSYNIELPSIEPTRRATPG